jgi:lipopolysaccharide/colanic/teichoic acid biosynthesis glycosyltransferase
MDYPDRPGGRVDAMLKRQVDVAAAGVMLVMSVPLLLVIALAIKIESRGPIFFRCRRVGQRGEVFGMVKFRKMHHGATGPSLTARDDDRLTRVGRVLARTKLDEIPQLWNVLTGEMSLVGPRPEDPGFVAARRSDFDAILAVRPGITGLSQLAFANESEILDEDDRVGDYIGRILPQKVALDRLYARSRSVSSDMRILLWTIVAVVFQRDVAVNRDTGAPGMRRRPRHRPAPTDAARTRAYS